MQHRPACTLPARTRAAPSVRRPAPRSLLMPYPRRAHSTAMNCCTARTTTARLRLALVACATVTVSACTAGTSADASSAEAAPAEARLFTRLPGSQTGVRFENRLDETRELNVFTYRNFYNGGGVGIGDLTGDGLPEVVLTSNQRGAHLYLNLGGFRFREITGDAGLELQRGAWTTGVSLADVDGDGRLDIYVCRAGPGEPASRANQLWINAGVNAEGNVRFVERAADFGLADQGFATQAAFLDYDRDGDLDLFLINNSPRPVSSFGTRNTRHVRDPWGGHKLYRNDGARFTDVSAHAGIHGSEIGFGLGVAVGDVNRDGWPDVYVSNDFFERDYLFVNRGDGTFDESLDRRTAAITYFSMGLDVADIDNDTWPDIYTTDMLPEDDYRFKLTAMFEGWDVYRTKVRNGYHHQFMRNMLQRNNHDGTFTEIGQMAGVAQTDWSWSALIADLDLDGWKDIFVTNGIAKDMTSQDYIAFLANEETMKSATRGGRAKVDFTTLTKAMTSTPLSNYAFRNSAGMRFANEAKGWGLDDPGFSSGAAYGDLDGDGAPDLVVNNVDGEAFVYRNNVRAQQPGRRFLQVRLEGEGANRFGVGARVTLHAAADVFMQEQAPARGFQSSVDYVLTFGLGAHERVDTLVVDWPDGRRSALAPVAVDQRITVRQADAAPGTREPARLEFAPRGQSVLTVVADSGVLPFRHRENDFVDFDRERLIPRMVSTEGPALAVGDVNADGLDDAFIGGAKGQAGALLLQRADGRFVPSNPGLFAADAIAEDVGAVFFDANGDGRPDLYVTSGGSEFSEGAPALQDRLYVNEGNGRFGKAAGALPPEVSSGSRPAAADFDGDGDVDLFVGGRVVPWRYGTHPQSMLLRNDGRGRFSDVTDELAPGLARIGMVTDALWRDVTGDRRVDLVLVGDWMPIVVFGNTGGRLSRLDIPGLRRSHGWWNRIVAADFDADGDVDFAAGNLGLNTRFRASDREPTSMLVKDFDGNGFAEQVVTTYVQGKAYPLPLRDDLIRAIPSLKARFLQYGQYAGKTVDEVFPPPMLAGALTQTAYTFASALVRNDGRGDFTLVPLPAAAQLAPIFAMVATDLDEDGRVDLLVAGNFDGFKPEVGRAAASYGVWLRGDAGGTFGAVDALESGFFVPGQARGIGAVRTRRGVRYLVARNDDSVLLFERTRAGRALADRAGER